jgi:hypothetical protein
MHPIIPSRWSVPAIFQQRLGEKVGRQRLMVADEHLLLILHKLPVPGAEEREPLLFWRNPQGDWQSTESGSGLANLKEHITVFDGAAEKLETRLNAQPTADAYFAVLQEATPLLRAARNLTGVLQQAREAVSGDRHILLARDEAVEIERHLELLHSEALHGLQFLVASRTEVQARLGEQLVVSSHRLNLLMSLCLPATALASVLGMNIRHGLEGQGTWIFWAVLAAAVVLGLIVVALVAAPAKPRRRQLPALRAI